MRSGLNNLAYLSLMHIAKIFGTNFTKNSYPQVTNYVNLSQTEHHVYINTAYAFSINYLSRNVI